MLPVSKGSRSDPLHNQTLPVGRRCAQTAGFVRLQRGRRGSGKRPSPGQCRRVENNSLAVSGQFDCFGNRIVNLSVARCQSLVTKIDISLANRVLDSQKNSQFPTVVDDTRLLNSACNQNSVQPFRPGRLRPKRRRNLRLAQILPNGLGHWLINARPDACCVEFDDGEEVGVVFFISCGYRPVLFEF